MVDSIINFGEYKSCFCLLIILGEDLPEETLKIAFENADKADLCLVLGSSLTVTPACKVPEKVGKNGKLAICNLQKTPLDRLSQLRVGSTHGNIHSRLDFLQM